MKMSSTNAQGTAVWEDCGQELISRNGFATSAPLTFENSVYRFFGKAVLRSLEMPQIAISIGTIVPMLLRI